MLEFCVSLLLPYQKADYLICLTESLKLFLRVPHYRMPFIEAKGLKP